MVSVLAATDTVRLNLGSGNYPLDGWTNIDAYTDCDVKGDVRDLYFRGVDEVRASHLLEHLPWRETRDVLARIRSWMRPGGTLTVEVPDMDTILRFGTNHELWFKYIYGDQSHRGEYHLAGFTELSLRLDLEHAGWQNVGVRRFVSAHPGREGMPCLEAEATA